MIEYRFTLLDAYVDVNELPTFVVAQEPVKQKFLELLHDLGNHNLMAKIRRVSGKLVISVFPKPKIGRPRNRINLALFLATVGTVLVFGYTSMFSVVVFGFALSNVDPRLTAALFGNSNLTWQILILAAGIVGIAGLHELGHVVAARHNRMDATLPYFIPVPPPFPFGTFGAVISLRAPPKNRDQLFDLGFSGPLAGFLATVGVTIVMILTSPIITQQQAAPLIAAKLLQTTSWPHEPLLFDLLSQIGLRTVPAGDVLVFTQFGIAAEFGALITFLNLLPVWQLDGGHISRAVFGNKGHKVTALVAFAILVLAGYWGFAVLLIVLMFLSRRPLEGIEPLDDLSPLSNTRKVLFALSLVMLILSLFVIF
jgi:membrane-associated protease RseP (regulator of RpoE activity)